MQLWHPFQTIPKQTKATQQLWHIILIFLMRLIVTRMNLMINFKVYKPSYKLLEKRLKAKTA